MATLTPRVLILGHSFIRRLFEYVHEHDLESFGLSQCIVDGLGISGATVDRLKTDLSVARKIRIFQPHIIVLQVGGNCLCNDAIRPDQLAYQIFNFAKHLHGKYGTDVYACEIFPRPRPRGMNSRQYESRRVSANKALHVLFTGQHHLHLWSHRRLFNSPLDLFLRDGCHLNQTGTKKFYRSLRLAVMHACTHLANVQTDKDEPCEDKPCKNGGTCTALGDDKGFFCTCPPTHTGTTCETVDQDLSISGMCAANPSLVMPHPTECQLYYNCSHVYDIVPRYFEQHMQECPYPQLFSTHTHSCQAFENVTCGVRTEHKSACKYTVNQCPIAQCYPCDLTFPSCEGRADGFYAHATKIGSPYFMVCRSERTVKTGRCPVDKKTGQPTFVKDGQCRIVDDDKSARLSEGSIKSMMAEDHL